MANEKTHKQGTRKTQIGSNGGGLLLLGGALAVGSLVAILAAHKGNRRRNSTEKKSSSMPKQDQPTHGLHFILQTSPPTFQPNNHPCCASNGLTTQIVPSELVSTHSLILEENPSTTHENAGKDDQEILLNHDSKQDCIEICKNHFSVEEFPLLEINNLSLHEELDKDAKTQVAGETNLMATILVAEEDAIDDVKMNIEEITSVQSTEDDDKEEKQEAKEKSLPEENVEVKTKENNLMDATEVVVEDAIDAVKTSLEEITSVQSTEEKEDDDKEENEQAKEKLPPEEKISIKEEKEPISEKTCAEKTSINSVEDRLNSKSITEVKEEEHMYEAAEKDAVDALKMSIEEENSSVGLSKEADIHSVDAKDGDDNDEMSDNEYGLKKSQENSGGTGPSSAGSDAYEIWPPESAEALSRDQANTLINSPLSAAKSTEQDENDKAEEFTSFNRSKNNNINSCRDINQIRGSSTFTKKERNLEFAVWNKQPTTYLSKWTISIEHMLVMASIVLLFLTYCNALSYLSSS